MIENRVELLRAQLQKALGLEMVIGVPDGTAADLFLFPYHLQQAQELRNSTDSVQLPLDCLDFFLIPTPRFEYAALEKAYRHIQGNPRAETDSCVIEYCHLTLSAMDLAQLFIAAHIPLTLCAAFQARFLARK